MTDIITTPQKTLLRSPNHVCRVWAAIHKPEAIFKARLTGTYSTTDMIAQITYGSVTLGAYTDIEDDQTLLVGSTDGGYDYGIARIRKTPTASILYINEGSEIDWSSADDTPAYLTVLKDWQIWPRHIKIVGDNADVYMDYDIAYTDQNTTLSPVANLGANAIYWLGDTTVDVKFFGSDSFCLGSSVSSYLWTCPEAASITNASTASPTFVFDTAYPGGVWAKCVETAANGKTTTAYRLIFVFDKDNLPHEIRMLSATGDLQAGEWTARLQLFADADRSLIRDRAHVILFAQDWYGDTPGSIGTLEGRENIIMDGWVSGESISSDRIDTAPVEFSVNGPAYWMGKINGYPAGVRDTKATSDKWTEFDNLTVDKGMYHFWRWRSTAYRVCDWHKSGDTRRLTKVDASNGGLWSQIIEMTNKTILVSPAFDRYGRLFTSIPPNLTPPADRAAIPVIMSLEPQDYKRPVNFERVAVRQMAKIFLNGVYATPTTVRTFYSLSPGHIPGRYGDVQTQTNLALSSQAQANILCGMLSATANNEFPSIVLQLAGNHRIFDIGKPQLGYVSIDPSYNIRGVGYTGYVIPKTISYSHDPVNLKMTVEVDFQAQTAVDLAVPGDPPGTSIWPPVEPPPPLTPWEPIPPITSVDPSTPMYVILRDYYSGLWLWSQSTGEWSHLTANQSLDECLEIGASGAPFSVQLLGSGGGIYAISTAGTLYHGDVANGLTPIYTRDWAESTHGANSYFDQVCTHPLTGMGGIFIAGPNGLGFKREHFFYTGFGSTISNRGSVYGGNYIGVTYPGWHDSGTLSFMASLDGIIRTTNLTSWSLVTNPGYNAEFLTRGGGYKSAGVYCSFDQVFRTSADSFATFTTKSSSPLPGYQFSCANDDLSVVLIPGAGVIKKSVDALTTFTDLPQTTKEIRLMRNFGASHFVGSILGYPDTDTIIYVSNDSGTSWTDISGDLRSKMYALTGNNIYIQQVEIVKAPFYLVA